jgi:uncharacterized protein DUF4058
MAMARQSDYHRAMPSPFPGMDPYLEHPALWSDVHNRMIAALADHLTPAVAPRYYVALKRRTYLLKPDDIVFVGRPDVAVVERPGGHPVAPGAASGATLVLDVEVPSRDEVEETYLQVHEVGTGTLVTIVELLSPANKLLGRGRDVYEQKREQVLATLTNLVEIDLLRAGEPMPVLRAQVRTDYRILVSRGKERPRAQLYAWSVRQPIPSFPLPLLPGDDEPTTDVQAVLAALYDRARFDLRLDYTKPPVPQLGDDDATWARGLTAPR